MKRLRFALGLVLIVELLMGQTMKKELTEEERRKQRPGRRKSGRKRLFLPGDVFGAWNI